MPFILPPEVQSFLSSYRYKIELHAHSSPISSCAKHDVPKMMSLLKKEHFDGVVLTNHFYAGGKFMKTEDPVSTYLADYYQACEEGEKVGIRVYLGAEYRFAENSNDYLVFGADEALLRETVTRFDMTFNQFYEQYHREDLLIVQAHPFRPGLVQMDPSHMDGVEAFNVHPHHNSMVALAARWGQENSIPVILAGTDFHNPGYEGLAATRTKILPKDNRELVALLRSGDYMMEIAGCPLLPYARF